jgi:type VI secretion system protein
MIGRAAFRAAMLGAGLAASGCAAPCLFDETGSVTVTVAPGGNRDSATAVDLVAAADETLADRLAGLDAAQYFAGRAQLQRDNPTTLTVAGWEIAPGQTVGPEEVRFPCGPAAMFVFAGMRAPGAHRVRLDDLGDVRVTIGPDEMEVAR